MFTTRKINITVMELWFISHLIKRFCFVSAWARQKQIVCLDGEWEWDIGRKVLEKYLKNAGYTQHTQYTIHKYEEKKSANEQTENDR